MTIFPPPWKPCAIKKLLVVDFVKMAVHAASFDGVIDPYLELFVQCFFVTHLLTCCRIFLSTRTRNTFILDYRRGGGFNRATSSLNTSSGRLMLKTMKYSKGKSRVFASQKMANDY